MGQKVGVQDELRIFFFRETNSKLCCFGRSLELGSRVELMRVLQASSSFKLAAASKWCGRQN